MIGILLLWLAFSPVQPALIKPAPVQPEQFQPQKELPTGIAEKIRGRVDRLNRQKSLPGSGVRKPVSNNPLERFYAARGFQPAWIKRPMIAELIAAVEESANEGLDPADYHIRELRAGYANAPATAELAACYDLLLTNSFFSLASHLRFGKVDPETLDTHWNLRNEKSRTALENKLHHAIVSGEIATALHELRLQSPQYDQLRKALARYRTIAHQGGWPVLAEGPKLQEGAREKRVLMLRQRLKVSGDIAPLNTDTSAVYNREMVDAVKRFQKRNGMDADGVVGTTTLRVMNIPVERRIEEIRLNLERYRWFLSDLEPTYVMVNIAGFTLQYV